MAVFKEYLYPTTRQWTSPDTTHDVNDTGTWSGSTDPSLIDEPQGAPDHNDRIATGLGPGAGFQDRRWGVSYDMTQVLPGIGINKVTLKVYFGSTSQSGLANIVNVELQGFLIIGATRYLHATAYTIEGKAGFQGFDPTLASWEWAINPATSLAFTVNDLQPGAIKPGIRFRALNDPTATNTPQGECSQLFLEYEGQASAANVEQIRRVLTEALRHGRVPVRTNFLDLSLQHGHIDIGKPIWLAHRRFPAPDGLGSGEDAGRRAPLIVLQKTPRVTLRQWRELVEDPVPYACTYWCPATTDIGSDVNNRGIARFDRGGGETHVRAQTGYVRRPPDGLWTSRLSNTPRYFQTYGLAVCGGGQVWHANNTFSQGTFPTITGWTLLDPGAGAITESTSDILFDLLGLKRSLVLTSGPTPATDYVAVHRTEAVEANRHIRLFIKYKTTGSGANRPRVRVSRSIDAWEWNGTAWAAPADQWRLPDNMGIAGRGPDSPGTRVEYWGENIPVGSTATNVTVYFGKSDGASVVTTLYAAGFAKSASGIAQTFARDFIVTTSAELTQVADRPAINNDPGFRVLNGLRATINFELVPMFDDADLVVGSRKSLYQGAWDADGTGGAPLQHFAGYYIKDDATTSRMVFVGRIVGGNTWTAQVTLSGNQRAQYLRPMKVAFRWTSDLGELGLPIRTLTVFVDGRSGHSGSGDNMQITKVGSRVYFRIVSLDGGATLDTEAEAPDAWFRNIEFRNWALRDEQVLRALG